MDFNPSPEVESLRERIEAFMDEHCYPVEAEVIKAIDDEVKPGVPYPQILVDIRAKAKEEGLWNLFLPGDEFGAGLANWEYGILCEQMGRSPIVAPMSFNCSAPDTGNAEILADHGTPEQKETYLQGLLEGEIRSCFSMTEPEVSGSDPTTLQTRAELVDGEWVINGHKWFTSGANGAEFAIAMVVTDPDAAPRLRADPQRVGDGTRRRARPLRDPLHGLPRPRGQPARRARRGLRDRPGPTRPRPHPPLHARHRHRGAGHRDDV
jgi:acyl-CoA dehydrogenase